jgi:hypothetical protein
MYWRLSGQLRMCRGPRELNMRLINPTTPFARTLKKIHNVKHEDLCVSVGYDVYAVKALLSPKAGSFCRYVMELRSARICTSS